MIRLPPDFLPLRGDLGYLQDKSNPEKISIAELGLGSTGRGLGSFFTFETLETIWAEERGGLEHQAFWYREDETNGVAELGLRIREPSSPRRRGGGRLMDGYSGCRVGCLKYFALLGDGGNFFLSFGTRRTPAR